jgi:Zn-dependent protease with chaperone function
MTGTPITRVRPLGRYRATASALLAAITVAVWPGLLVPFARAYAEFSFHHPSTTPLFEQYPPFVVAALFLWMTPLLVIAATQIMRQVIGQYRLERRTRGRRVPARTEWTDVARKAGIANRLFVIADDTPFAFCAGFFIPAVYVSHGLLSILSADEIEAVLRHEASHLQRRDPMRLFLIELARSLLAPFPIVETFCDRVWIGIELAADRAALAIVPMPALAGAVLKVARASRSDVPYGAAGLTASEARIDALLGKPIQVAFTRRDVLVTGMVLFTLVLVVAHLWSIKLCPICPTI